jgi:hypothetical protein
VKTVSEEPAMVAATPGIRTSCGGIRSE